MIEQEDNNASNDDENDWMSKLLESPMFKNIPFEDIHKIFMLFEKIEVAKNDTVIKQGEAGDYYYIIEEGRFRVSRKIKNQKKEFKLADLEEGAGFGEEALIGNVKRNATVTALTNGNLIRINENDFVNLIKEKVLKSISYDDTKKMVKDGAICLDARFKNEFDKAALKLKGCINSPINTLRLEADKLDKNKEYIVYCDNGARSAIVAFLLMERGFNVSYLEGGLERLPLPDSKDKEPDVKDDEAEKEELAKKSEEDSQNGMISINTAKIISEQSDILSKLNLGDDKDMNEMSKVLSLVLSNIYKQLGQALEEKANLAAEKRIIEEKLQSLLDKNNN
ncbi:MAG: cyclic nucleotide-binding domain-containing protein [Proteobacteria bacterium]|nr:cyclic nucleotide-binding domain-containing protein [Pseudomonadota bacterium]